jgi:hypothetical protein
MFTTSGQDRRDNLTSQGREGEQSWETQHMLAWGINNSVCFRVTPTKWYWNTVSHTKSPLSGRCLQQKGVPTGGGRRRMPGVKTKQASCNVAKGIPKSTPGSVLTLREGSESTPRTGITVRPKLARRCCSNTMM